MNLVSRLFLKGNSPSRTIAFIFEPDMKPTIASATLRSSRSARRPRRLVCAFAQSGASADWARHDCSCGRAGADRPIAMATERSPGFGCDFLRLTIAFASDAIVAAQHLDDHAPGGSAMRAQHLRRVTLIERQRDQSESESETVSSARARQRPVPACSSLPPLSRDPPSRWRARSRRSSYRRQAGAGGRCPARSHSSPGRPLARECKGDVAIAGIRPCPGAGGRSESPKKEKFRACACVGDGAAASGRVRGLLVFVPSRHAPNRGAMAKNRRRRRASRRGTKGGTIRRPAPKPAGQPRPKYPSVEPSGPLGAPEQSGRPLVTDRVAYTAEPVFPEGDPTNSLTSGPIGRPGQYRVTFVLAVPGRNVVQETVDFQAAVENGDSLLAVNPDVHELRLDFSPVEGGDGGPRVVVRMNSDHRLRDLSVELRARRFRGAAQGGHDLVMPILSRWSYLHDVSITTSGMLIEELATGTVSFETTVVGAVKGFSDTSGVSTPEHRLLLAAYREGLSSAEPLWRALSLYKVAEGVWALRSQRRRERLAAGEAVNELSERVPADVTNLGHPREIEALAASLRPYAGKKFRVAFDDIRSRLRNSIAHLDPDADPLAQDTWDDVRRVYEVLPGLRWMSRKLLEAELSKQS